MKLQYIKTHPLATFEQSTQGSAGFDLTACNIEDNGTHIVVDYGIKVAIPKNHVGLLVPRSSTPKKYNVIAPHGTGIIDSDYRGNLYGLFTRIPSVSFYRINPADRIGQLIIVQLPEIETVLAQNLPEFKAHSKTQKKRVRTGGIGSTDNVKVTT